MGIAEEVFELLEPVVTTAGAELFDVEWSGTVLRVLVDAEEGIEVDALAKINRLVSPILDEDDPIPGAYTLEVSSPGVERQLRRVEHYEGALGEVVTVRTFSRISFGVPLGRPTYASRSPSPSMSPHAIDGPSCEYLLGSSGCRSKSL